MGRRAEARMEKEKEEVAKVEGRGLELRRKVLRRRWGNIVLNRKIGILINIRGLSIKGRGKRACEGGGERRERCGTMTRSVRFILRASSTLALMSSLTRPEDLRRNRLYRNENLDV